MDGKDSSNSQSQRGDEELHNDLKEPQVETATLLGLLEYPSALYEALSSQERRYVLYYLLSVDNEAMLGEIVEYVSARLADTIPQATTSGQRNQTKVRLISVDLPKLEDFGLIEWDSEGEHVTLSDSSILLEG